MRSGRPLAPGIVVLTGPAGVGKTTVGRLLAQALGWRFLDADALHPAANVERMARGEPLDDADRAPWLAAVRATLADAVAQRAPVVVACSALRRRYRDAWRLTDAPAGAVRFVELVVPTERLRARLDARRDHFAPPALLPSQLAALEPPGVDEYDALRVDGEGAPDEVAARIRRALRLRAAGLPPRARGW